MNLVPRQIYFRYDHAEGLRGGTYKNTYHTDPAITAPSRKAPQELAWRNSRFIDAVINRSRAERGADDGRQDGDEKQSDNERRGDDGDESHSEAKLDNGSDSDSSDTDESVSGDNDDSSREPAPRRFLSHASQQIREARNQYVRSLPKSQVFPMNSVVPESEISDDDVWQIADRLRWVDRDEIERSPEYIANVLSPDDCAVFYSGGLRLAMKLEPVFADNPAYAALGITEKKDLLFHIMGKGLYFYTFVLQCPEVALYLFENKWQPLYVWILNRATSLAA